MSQYKAIARHYSEEEKRELKSFLRDKDYEWSSVLEGEVQEVSPTTFEHLLEDVREGRNDRKKWFRIKSALAMINYESNGKWSNLEEKMRKMLESLGLEMDKDFYHNWKLNNEDRSGYFTLDFLLPDYKKVIECDGVVWHESLGNVEEKDKRRDKWLKRLGFDTLRFDNEELRDEEQIRNTLQRELFR